MCRQFANIWRTALVRLSQCQVFQPHQISVTEGDPVNIQCQQNATSKDTMYWYKMVQNGRLEFLALGYDETMKVGSFSVTFKLNDRSTDLKKDHSEPTDAATYYCAVRDTVIADVVTAKHKQDPVKDYRLCIERGNICFLQFFQ
uniref:Ig-like domain-containing protein n=1 Tax=Leptobrachium leishanense TaxID=445787 RepID=A0A8C5M7Y8_9ANUR